MTAVLTPDQPGTLLWIGPTRHPEVTPALRCCGRHAAQIAIRRSIPESLRRPAGHVCRVIIARTQRQTHRRTTVERLMQQYDTAEFLVLTGQLCDGESRTGSFVSSLTAATSDRFLPPDLAPLAQRGGLRLRFSRWQEQLPQWLTGDVTSSTPAGSAPVGSAGADLASGLPTHRQTLSWQTLSRQTGQPGRAAILIVADRWETAEPLCQWAEASGRLASWHRRYVPALHRGIDWVLWDDSAAPPAAAAVWQQRLHPAITGGLTSGLLGRRPQHAWLAHQPSLQQMVAAERGGVAAICTKPLALAALERQLQSTG